MSWWDQVGTYPGFERGFSWVSNDRSPPTAYIVCQGCERPIVFSREEILARRTRGTNTSTPCRHCGWHPAYPPEPWSTYPLV